MEKLPLSPYKSIGMVLDGNSSYRYDINGKAYLALTTGKSYKIYSLPTLSIKFLSPSFDSVIDQVVCLNEEVFVVLGNRIVKMRFSHQTNEISFDCQINCVYLIGRLLLVSLQNGSVHILHSADFSDQGYFNVEFKVERMFHPLGYLNKIILYSKDNMALYNINTKEKLFSYREDREVGKLLLDDSLLCLKNSPATDVVGLGFASGKIVGLNLKSCEVYFEYQQSSAVKSLAFTLDSRNEPFIVSGDDKGGVNVWSLNEGTLHTKLTDQFNTEIDYIDTIQLEEQELLLVGSGQGNAMRLFNYNKDEAKCYSLLRKKEAAIYPIKQLQLYKDYFLCALTEDPSGELVKYTVTNDSATAKVSKKFKKKNKHIQTEMNRKTEDIVEFVISENNTKISDNKNLITLHKNSPFPLFWDFENLTIKNVFLELFSSYKADIDKNYAKFINKSRVCTSIDISYCGNYAFIGFNDNYMIKLSTQSGTFNSYFKCDLTGLTEKGIRHIYCDLSNNHIIVAIENKLVLIDFFNGRVLNEKTIETGFDKLYYDRTMDVFVLENKDHSLDVYKTRSLQKVRSLQGHKQKVTALSFAPLHKKIIACDTDRTMIIWDIFLEEALYTYKLEKNVASLQMDEKKMFLYMAYSGEKDIKIWTVKNLNLSHSVPVDVKFVSNIRKVPRDIKSYYVYGKGSENEEETGVSVDVDEQLIKEIEELMDEKKDCLSKRSYISFTEDAEKWNGLLHIETMHDRNKIADKDIEEQKDDDLPFFLNFGDNYLDTINKETLGTLAPKDNKSKRLKPDEERNDLMESSEDNLERLLSRVSLESKNNTKVFDELFKVLKEKTSYEIDYFVKRLSLLDQNAFKLLLFLDHILSQNSDFDLKLLLSKLFFNTFYDKILESEEKYEEFVSKIKSIRKAIGSKCSNVEKSYYELSGVIENLLIN